MPVPKTAVVAGAYQATWNGLDIGQVGLGGFRHRWNYTKKDIFFDSVGNIPVDQLMTGVSMYLDFIVMQVAQSAIPTLTWPWSIVRGTVPAAGARIWDLAKPLELIACDQINTTPKTLSFIKTIIAPDYEMLRNFSGTEEQMIPIRMAVLPVAYLTPGPYYTISAGPPITVTYNANLTRPVACTDNVYYVETYPA